MYIYYDIRSGRIFIRQKDNDLHFPGDKIKIGREVYHVITFSPIEQTVEQIMHRVQPFSFLIVIRPDNQNLSEIKR